jgi:hypothetical protein
MPPLLPGNQDFCRRFQALLQLEELVAWCIKFNFNLETADDAITEVMSSIILTPSYLLYSTLMKFKLS